MRAASSRLGGRARLGGRDAELPAQGLEPGPVFGLVDGVDAGAEDRDAELLEPPGQAERRLAADLDDHALGLFVLDDLEHVFER